MELEKKMSLLNEANFSFVKGIAEALYFTQTCGSTFSTIETQPPPADNRSPLARMSAEVQAANHKSHECRHTFRTRLSRAGAHEVCINMIMGHKSGNVGTDVYDHRTFDELKKAVEMIS